MPDAYVWVNSKRSGRGMIKDLEVRNSRITQMLGTQRLVKLRKAFKGKPLE
jgi:hypothetical protein